MTDRTQADRIAEAKEAAPTAEDSRALLERHFPPTGSVANLARHLLAALDREAALIAERDAAKQALVDVREETIRQNLATDADYAKRLAAIAAERDAARAEVEKLRSEKQAAENMSTVRAIEIVMARCKMHQEVQRVMRVQLHNARGALTEQETDQ